MRLTRIFAAAAAFALTACSVQAGLSPEPASAKTSIHPESGLAVIALSIRSGPTEHAFRVEVAQTAAQQEHGLMFRRKMGANEGMIFPMQPPRNTAFWMRNTVIPLDIIFIGPDRRILNIAANAVPYDETPLPSAGKVSAVLELNGGRAGQLGIKAGDTVRW